MSLPPMPDIPSLAPFTLPPMPSLPPMVTLAPLELPTLPPSVAEVVSSLAPVMVSLAPTVFPILTTLAPKATKAVSDAISSGVCHAGKAVAGALSNVTKCDEVAIGTAVVSERHHHVKQVTGLGNGGDVVEAHIAKEDDGGFVPAAFRPFVIPVIGLVVGSVMMQYEPIKIGGKLVLYFGAQSFMNIFMSWCLGTRVTIEAGTTLDNGYVLLEDLKGCPAGFALTALQQVVSFILVIMYFAAVQVTAEPYMPKRLKTNFEYASVVIFGCVFAANIALNNFSLGYISIGVNLIIRSCLPLSTYLSQQGLSMFGLYQRKPFRLLEVFLMSVGVVCACVFTYADFEGKLSLGGRFIGVLACLGSLLCGSLNLALAGVLGDTQLNVLDTCAYMAIPATLFLLPIIFFVPKPVPGAWQHVGSPSMTDWQILESTWQYSPSTIGWLFLSGVFSFMYNICQFTIVHTLSPSATAFGGNFNKAALTFMTLSFTFLQTKPPPSQPYKGFEWAALICNICAFGYYSYLQIMAKMEAKKKEEKKLLGRDELTDSEADEEEGSTASE